MDQKSSNPVPNQINNVSLDKTKSKGIDQSSQDYLLGASLDDLQQWNAETMLQIAEAQKATEDEDAKDDIEKRYGQLDPVIRKMVEIPEDDPLDKIEDEEKREMLKMKR